ncbi:isochorismate synthase [Streptomyces griseoviridis]|uniref:isochorismate synthase n=1 Tax=Streptomyces griseoviridis TaxID=45398 RepID=A0ABT9LQ36_STRGD|nr:isochorismate synthase [Streptomyces griseoviridis]MDP9685663.1 isochorismate synthase [Streptomyces griseoviridis]GGS89096.1 isochorismate synthase DhbC [Streptomyces griseoviridis]
MSLSAVVRPRPVHLSADLLAAYLTGSFYFSSARGTLLADGVRAHVRATGGTHAPAAAEALEAAATAGLPEPVVVGAVGFRPGARAGLVVPAVVRRAGAPADPRPPAVAPGTDWRVTPRPGPAAYAEAVRRALELIDGGELRKVVLARCLELTSASPVWVPALLARLVHADPACYAFAADVTAPGDPAPRTLVGASPELLVSRRGATVTANPLAGSAPRSGDDAVDRERIAALRASAKDLGEHAHTADRVAEVLAGFCTDLRVPERPEVIGTPTMWHLSTRITGRLRDPADPASSALGLAEALHPTPAVCGVPTDGALAAIEELEPEDRGYYAGMAGWTGLDGDGEWAVAIRSAEVCDRTVRLFAGAGVVAGSDPRAELAETAAKFRTLLRAVGLTDVV